MRKGVLPARIPTAKFLHNGKEMTEPVQLQDGDTYTIIFIDGNGQQINK